MRYTEAFYGCSEQMIEDCRFHYPLYLPRSFARDRRPSNDFQRALAAALGRAGTLRLFIFIALTASTLGTSIPSKAQVLGKGPCTCPGASADVLDDTYPHYAGVYYWNRLEVPSSIGPDSSCVPATASFNGTNGSESGCEYTSGTSAICFGPTDLSGFDVPPKNYAIVSWGSSV